MRELAATLDPARRWNQAPISVRLISLFVLTLSSTRSDCTGRHSKMCTTLTLTALLTTTVHAVLGQTPFDPLNGAFDKKAEELLDVLHIPGISIAVVQGDKIASKVCHPFSTPFRGQHTNINTRSMASNSFLMYPPRQTLCTTPAVRRKPL